MATYLNQDKANAEQTVNQRKEIIKTSYVNDQGVAPIVCPYCNKVKAVPIRNMGKRICKIKVKCTCSNSFRVNVDHRKNYRKVSEIIGTLSLTSGDIDQIQVKIKDISFGGACLETYGEWGARINQLGQMVFTLNDQKQTTIKKKFTVKSRKGRRIGCKFIDEKAYEKDLGFYLRK